jgi:hypothetical protein
MSINKETKLYFDRSGTEEEYIELEQLLEDISSYKEGLELQRSQAKEAKKRKLEEEKRKGSDITKAAMERMSSMYNSYSICATLTYEKILNIF